MRRISYLFTLLLLIVGAVSAYAQTPTATPIAVEEVPEGYYFIASTNESAYGLTNPYIVPNGSTAMKLVSQSDVTTDISTSNVGIWYIKKVEGSGASSKYTIRNIDGLYWVSYPNCPLANRSTNVGYYQFALTGTGANSYYLKGAGGDGADKITNTNPVWASSATSFARNPSTGSENYNKWKLIPAGVKDITLNYTAGTNHFSVSKLVGTGKELSTSLDFYKDFEPATITPDDATSSYSVTCAYNFPFEFGKYYKMKICWASTNGSDQQSDGVYTYRSVVWNGQVKGGISTRDVVTETNNALWSFQIVEGTANQVYLSNALGGQKVTIDNATTDGLKAYMSPVGTPFYVKRGNTGSNYTNGFRLQSLTNENANLNDISGGLGYRVHGSSREDAGSTFTIIGEAASCVDQEINTVVATNTANNEVITVNNLSVTEKLTGKTGDKLLCNAFFTTSDGSYDSSTKTFTVNYTSTAPYLLSGTTEETRHWQAIRSRNDNGHYLKLSGNNVASGSGNAGSVNRSSLSAIKAFNESDEVQWGIVPADGGFNRFYLVNKANATKKAYLASETQGTLVTFTDKGTPFYLAAQPTLDGYTGGFTIQPNNSNTHAVGDHCSDNLGYWSNRGSSELVDAGSIFHADLLADCKAIVDAQTGDESYVGSLAPSVPTTLNALNGSGDQASITAYLAKYDELLASTGNDVYTTPEENALYRITFNRASVSPSLTNSTANANGEVNEDEANRLLTYVTSTTNTPSAIVRFIKRTEDNTYYIQDVNSGLYYGYYGNGSSYVPETKLYGVKDNQYAGHYSIINSYNGTLTYVALKDNRRADDHKMQCLWLRDASWKDWNYVAFHSSHHDNEENNSNIEDGCVLRIQKVTTYPVSVSAAGYASLCLPFSVTLPQSGLTAYKVTDINRNNNNEMTLESVGSTIPAGEPVILQGAAGNYTLTINADNGTKATNNILTGATVKRTGISEEYYALAKKTIDETETVAFFRVSTTNMPANKAYLLKKNIPAQAVNAAMFMFNFDGNGGEVTDINTATKAETESNVYYDLNGRRVLYPSHGIYVKGNGQKVFIK